MSEIKIFAVGCGITSFTVIFITIIFMSIFHHPVYWEHEDYPNPLNNFTACNMDRPSYICDPDNILWKEQRGNLQRKLEAFKEVTQKSHENDRCKAKGVTAAIALTQYSKDISYKGLTAFTNTTLRKWNLDPECNKSLLIFVVVSFEQMWIAFDKNVPINDCGFQKMHIQYREVTANVTYAYAGLSSLLNTLSAKIMTEEYKTIQCTKTPVLIYLVVILSVIAFPILSILLCYCFPKFLSSYEKVSVPGTLA